MKVRKVCLGFYNFCVTIPDRLYPFAEEIDGNRVRFRRAYEHALARVQDARGYGAYGARLITYRGLWHVIGAILFITFATLVSKDLFGNDVALYILLLLASLALVVQEFYVHPRTHGQMRLHGVVDVLSWIVPFGVYLFIHV